jgi:hypothetical protein
MTVTESTTAELRALVHRLEHLLAGPDARAATDLDGYPAHVAPGELIESAWGNAVVDTLQYHKRTAGTWVTWGGAETVLTDAGGHFVCPLKPPLDITLAGPIALTAVCANEIYGIWLAVGNITLTQWNATAYNAAGTTNNYSFPVMWTAVGFRSP